MWKPLQKSPPYFITFVKETEDFYYVGVTDYRRYWINNTSRKSFMAEMKESNDGLEFDDENELVRRGLDMLNNPETLKKVSILQEDGGELLTVSMTKVYEFPLKLEMGLLLASHNHFFTKIIQPLLKTICDLHSSERALRELLMKKDREIEEYKIEGKAPRRLITTVYNDAAHMATHTTYEEYFGASEVPELLEATANAVEHKNKTSQPKTTTPATTSADKKEKITAQSRTLPLPKDSNINVLTVLNIPEKVAKIEKFSQNSLVDEKLSIVPTQIEETEIPEHVVSTAKLNESVKSETNGSSQKRRRKNKLNY